MRRTRTCLSALALAGLITGSALAQGQAVSPSSPSGQQKQQQQQQQQSSNAKSGTANGQQSQNAPEGWILIEERVVMLTTNEPQNHFLRAEQLLGQKDAKAAAAEVNVGAAYLDMQRARANKQADDQLSSSADRLRQLAGDLRKSGGGDVQHQQQQLAEAFASANYALAKHFQGLASKDLDGKKAIAAGYDLGGAADSLAAAYLWSKKEAPKDAVSAIADARRTANDLIAADSTMGSAAKVGGQSQSTDNAQTASAKQGSSASGQSTGAIPADASKTLDQLGKAIQQASGAFAAGGQQKADAQK